MIHVMVSATIRISGQVD